MTRSALDSVNAVLPEWTQLARRPLLIAVRPWLAGDAACAIDRVCLPGRAKQTDADAAVLARCTRKALRMWFIRLLAGKTRGTCHSVCASLIFPAGFAERGVVSE